VKVMLNFIIDILIVIVLIILVIYGVLLVLKAREDLKFSKLMVRHANVEKIKNIKVYFGEGW